jgi:large subunit ribosomal protein L29
MAKKKKDVRDLDEREITQQLTEMEEQMFRMRFQMSMGQTDGLKKIRVMRKERARLLTIRRERELAAVPAGAPVKVGK